MSHSRFALGFTRHRKIRDLSDAAFRLWASAIDFARGEGSDGDIRQADIELIPTFARSARQAGPVKELVEAGLWEAAGEGWLIHDYLDWQDSSKAVAVRRERARERMRSVRANVRENETGTCGERSPDVSDGPIFCLSSSDPDPDPDPALISALPRPSGARDSETRAKVRRVFDFWKQDTGHHRATMDSKRDSRIRARLREGFSAERLEAAIRNRRNDPFLMGANDTGRVWDGLETLLRDAAQVERLEALTQQQSLSEVRIKSTAKFAPDHEAARLEANSRQMTRENLLDRARDGEFGPKAQAAADAGTLDLERLEAHLAEQKAKRAAAR